MQTNLQSPATLALAAPPSQGLQAAQSLELMGLLQQVVENAVPVVISNPEGAAINATLCSATIVSSGHPTRDRTAANKIRRIQAAALVGSSQAWGLTPPPA